MKKPFILGLSGLFLAPSLSLSSLSKQDNQLCVPSEVHQVQLGEKKYKVRESRDLVEIKEISQGKVTCLYDYGKDGDLDRKVSYSISPFCVPQRCAGEASADDQTTYQQLLKRVPFGDKVKSRIPANYMQKYFKGFRN
jgi:hypothetical protein